LWLIIIFNHITEKSSLNISNDIRLVVRATKDFINGYMDIYKQNIGAIVGALGAPELYKEVGHLINLSSNQIIYGMLISAVVGAVLGHKYLNRVFNRGI